MPVVIVRLFNTVGRRQTGAYGMVIPTFVRQALQEQRITVFGTGEQSRSFLHVSDALDAMTALMEAPSAVGEVFNVGHEDEVTINELAERMRMRTGSDVPIHHVVYREAYGDGFEEMMRRVPDAMRLRRLIGFRPQHDLDQILDEVVEQP